MLIIVCATDSGEQAARDCYLAGENLMLAAPALGLATCPIGFAWSALEMSLVKAHLNIPTDYRAVLPVIVGYPRGEHTHPSRRPPRVLSTL